MKLIGLGNDVEFWKMLQQRRRRTATLTSDDIRRTFGIPPSSEVGASAGMERKRRSRGTRNKR